MHVTFHKILIIEDIYFCDSDTTRLSLYEAFIKRQDLYL